MLVFIQKKIQNFEKHIFSKRFQLFTAVWTKLHVFCYNAVAAFLNNSVLRKTRFVKSSGRSGK